MAQPRQLCGELSACNFCAALERVSFGKQGLTLDFQTFGGRRLGKEGVYGALGSRSWDHRGWRRNSFRGLGELEGKVQLCSTSRERLKPKTCLADGRPRTFSD